MNAAACFAERITAQGIEIPPRLEKELHLKCMLPFLSIFDLWDRLMKGCVVLDRHGDIDAPDHLWQRWEAIFIAWHCCQESFDAIEAERSMPTSELATLQVQSKRPQATIKGIRRRER